MTMKPKAVSLREAAARIGLSYQTGRRRVAEGTFPIPELPRTGRSWHRYSERDIDRYLDQAATADVRRFSVRAHEDRGRHV